MSDYNVQEVKAGHITATHLRVMVGIVQEKLGLRADGLCGPLTKNALTELIARSDDYMTRLAKPGRENSLSIRALEAAISQVGRGEAGGNNFGPAISQWREETGLSGHGAWCSVFISWCFWQAAEDHAPPFPMHRNAKRLIDNIGAAGRFLDTPQPGSVICWSRGIVPRQGHIEIVLSHELGRLVTVGGNKGPYPSRVKYTTHKGGEWRKRLYKIATID